MMGNFHCTHCGYRYDFHPGRCRNCNEVAVIYDGKQDEFERRKKEEAQQASQRKAATENARKSPPSGKQQKDTSSAKSSSGSSSVFGVLALLVIGYFILKGKSSEDKPLLRQESSSTLVVPENKYRNLKSSVETPADREYTNRQITVNNECGLPVKIAIRYMNSDGEWQTCGWWNYEPNSIKYLRFNGEDVNTYNSKIYYCAETPDKNYSWTGTHEIYYNSKKLNMRLYDLNINGDNEFELRITCTDYKEKESVIEAPVTNYRYYIGIRGVNMDTIADNNLGINYGVLIKETITESPAEKAGLLPGDILLFMNGIKIFNIAELNTYLSKHSEDPIIITYSRNGENYNIEISPKLYKLE